MLEITEIPCTLRHGATEAGCLETGTRETCKLLGIDRGDISRITLHRKSIDARKKSNVRFMLSVRVELTGDIDELDLLERVNPRDCRRVRAIDPTEPHFPSPADVAADAASGQPRPVVVGAGCAGLFAALTLAEAGLRPLLIELGDDATRRTQAVRRFNETGELDPTSNIQFGLGGAGTFSDGKLNTGTKSPLHRLVLHTLVEAGAPRDILWDAKPHIGSDILPDVVTNIVEHIRTLGGEVRFRTRLTDLEIAETGELRAIRISGGSAVSSHEPLSADSSEGGAMRTAMDNGRPIPSPHLGNAQPNPAGTATPEELIPAERVIIACGHSARDIFGLLRKRGVRIRRKTFAMGVRIEHLQADIDRALYGTTAGHPSLGAAPYSLVAHTPNGRSLFSFCMCPGGEVVAAASEPGGVVTNGASLHARAGRNANAALLVNIEPEDLPGTDPLEGVNLQRSCEQAAFAAGGGEFVAPAQLVGDFLEHRPSAAPGRVKPTYPRGVTWTMIDDLLPAHVIETLREGIPLLNRKIRGYSDPEAVLTAVETRSSSPVTVVRDRETCMSESTPGLFPCGEGAGYAGGIMSAAADGIRCARALIASL